MTDTEVEKVWREFWAPILTDEDGNVDLELVKAELFDWHFAMGQVSQVYSTITNGTLSKPNYYASGVISAYEEVQEEDFRRRLEDWLYDHDLPTIDEIEEAMNDD